MKMPVLVLLLAISALIPAPSLAQQIKGTVVTITGQGNVHADNDQAHVTFFIEEQDKDKSAAASRVNDKIRHGTELLKKLDPDGSLATRGYYTHPVYTEPTSAKKQPEIVSWRVGQYLSWTTKNLLQLPTTAAELQQLLALSDINFDLSDELAKKLESQRLSAAYANLQQKIQMIATAMGKNPADATLESLDVDGSGGNFLQQPRMRMSASMMAKSPEVQETSFEPGETTLGANIVAKIRFN